MIRALSTPLGVEMGVQRSGYAKGVQRSGNGGAEEWIVYTVQYILYSIYCTVYTVQYILSTPLHPHFHSSAPLWRIHSSAPPFPLPGEWKGP